MALFPVARAARAARPAPEPTYFQHPPMLATKATQSSSASTHPATDATAHSEREGDERYGGENTELSPQPEVRTVAREGSGGGESWRRNSRADQQSRSGQARRCTQTGPTTNCLLEHEDNQR